MVIDLTKLRFFDPNVGTLPVVGVVTVRDDGIQTVVASRKLQDHQDSLVVGPLCGQRVGREPKQWHPKAAHRSKCDTIRCGLEQIPTLCSVAAKAALFHQVVPQPS